MDFFLVLKENTLSPEDRHTNSHGMTSHVQIEMGADLFEYSHSFTEGIISVCGKCSVSMYRMTDYKNT